MSRSSCVLGAAALALLMTVDPTAAQDPFTWENATELSFVTTGGNATSSTLGLKSTLDGTGGPRTFKLEIGGIRASSDITERTAVGTPGSFTVNEVTTNIKSAENYFARGRFDRDVEVAFLLPWAVAFRNAELTANYGMLAFWDGVIFVSILVVGFAYLWARGDLKWIRPKVHVEEELDERTKKQREILLGKAV